MKRAIVTAAIGHPFEEMAKLTVPTQQAYARRVGAAHFRINADISFLAFGGGSHWMKFAVSELMKETTRFEQSQALEVFDEVAWLDSDVVVRPDAPDIFEEAGGCFAAFPEGDVVERLDAFREYYRRLRGKELPEAWSLYINSGVMVIPKQAIEIMELPKSEEIVKTMEMREENPGRFFRDQNLINARLAETGTHVNRLSYKWNLMHVPAEAMGIKWEDRTRAGYMIHYAGLANYLGDGVLDVIRNDLKEWGEHYDQEKGDKEKSG